MKEKIIDYIERLEAKAMQSDEYCKQRIELYVENQKLKSRIDKANNDLIILIQIIMQQPSQNEEVDNWLLGRLEAIQKEMAGEDK